MEAYLRNRKVLFVDCQATGPHPESSYLLEIGWARSDTIARDPDDRQGLHACFVRLPDGTSIPTRVKKVTGICAEDIAGGFTHEEIWKTLRKDVRSVMRSNRSRTCLTVIHYAKYERPFLEMLHREQEPGSSFPFDIICTHQIARRLFPELPRRGLKALAGYFGYASDEKRRSGDHIKATAHIWDHMLHILETEHQVRTLTQLKKWLERIPVRSITNRWYPMQERYRRHLPDTPGVYQMCRSKNDILYVGKATSLKKRVNSYFTKKGKHADHILEMLTQARRIKVIETASSLEAALLESDEIKKHDPPYNRALRYRSREVMYTDSSYNTFFSKPSRSNTVGPLVSREPFEQLALLKSLITLAGTDISSEIVRNTLTLSEFYRPDMDSIEAGIELFLEHHQNILSQSKPCNVIRCLGQQLWLQRQQDINVADYEGDDLTEDEKDMSWSPEHVSKALENVVIRSMHTIRRARLSVLFSESSIAWQEPGQKGSECFLLVFSKGEVIQRAKHTMKKRLPVPPGYKRKFLARQRSFDVMTVDRMRVLITEVRKLAAAGQWIRVCLRPKRILDNDKLQKIFKWI